MKIHVVLLFRPVITLVQGTKRLLLYFVMFEFFPFLDLFPWLNFVQKCIQKYIYGLVMNKTICLQYLEVNSSQKIINKFSKASVICLSTTMVGLGFFSWHCFVAKTSRNWLFNFQIIISTSTYDKASKL